MYMYLTYLQENFKPVAHRSASVEVFDEEDAQVVHSSPSYPHIGDAKELEVVDAMDAGCRGPWIVGPGIPS